MERVATNGRAAHGRHVARPGWLEATGNVLGGGAYFSRPASRGSVTAQVVHSSPAEGSFSMYTMFLLAMSSARQSIYITNPYFLPDDRMTRALTEAARRGVRVVLLLPGAIDNRIVRHASRAGFGELCDRQWVGDDREHQSGHALVRPERGGEPGRVQPRRGGSAGEGV